MAIWIETYRDISRMPADERPSSDILDDDHQLDLYLQGLERKRKQKR